ncbi:MAG: hypothetical protein ACOYNS_13405 [Bacteroidota bacterium]
MDLHSLKNISVYTLAVLLLGGAFYAVHRHDEQVMNGSFRWGKLNDTLSTQPSEQEQRIARQFTDTTLPQLRRLGLVKRFTSTQIETVVTVSGSIWNERSDFFKESFLTQILVYNRVNGFTSRIRVVDERTERIYAQVTPPDRKEFF